MSDTATKTTRERILDAANMLFYSQGIRDVSVDAVAEKAGVTKKTLYYHFKSKDELMEGYLVSCDQPNLMALAQWYETAEGDAANKTKALFLRLAQQAQHPKWKGCGFIRTAAELANMPGHPAVKAGASHKKKFEAWLTEQYKTAGLANAAQTARSVVLLMEGAFSMMLIHRDPSYAESAAEAVSYLVNP